jgi:superoxide dismutase, Cu-Zn family
VQTYSNYPNSLFVGSFIVMVFSVAALGAQEQKPFAIAALQPKSSTTATGKVTFWKKQPDTMHIEVVVEKVTPGLHGIHLHERGDCSASDAKSAGEHYSPLAQNHGAPGVAGSHAGDLGNIKVEKNGRGKLSLDLSSKDEGVQAAWGDIVGKSVVLHASEDDLKSQPSGNSGARIACGVIEAAK